MKQFLQAIEEVEKLLIWISENQFVGDSVSEVMNDMGESKGAAC